MYVSNSMLSFERKTLPHFLLTAFNTYLNDDPNTSAEQGKGPCNENKDGKPDNCKYRIFRHGFKLVVGIDLFFEFDINCCVDGQWLTCLPLLFFEFDFNFCSIVQRSSFFFPRPCQPIFNFRNGQILIVKKFERQLHMHSSLL